MFSYSLVTKLLKKFLVLQGSIRKRMSHLMSNVCFSRALLARAERIRAFQFGYCSPIGSALQN